MASFQAGGITEQVNVTATAAGTTTLVSSTSVDPNLGKQIQVFTGVLTQTVVLPNATLMKVGQKFEIFNQSTAAIAVHTNGGASLISLPAGSSALLRLQTNGTSAGTWMELGAASLPTFIPPTTSIATGTTSTGGFSGIASGTYTPPMGALYLKVKMCGPGGGGSGSYITGGSNGSNGSTDTNINVNSGSVECGPGHGGVIDSVGGTGGVCGSVAGTGVQILVALNGGAGQGYNGQSSTASNIDSGASGGANPFGGAGTSNPNANGTNGLVGTGAGGGGGGNASNATYSGSGGGAGAYSEAIISGTALAAMSFSVGLGGAGGAAGSQGKAGGNGGDGIIIIEEYYQ
jgi:hypothetical protein